jgi:hypothetical protein
MELLVWIRDWNRAHPEDQIRIAGYQPEQPVTDVAGLRQFTDRFASERREALEAAIVPCKVGDAVYMNNLQFIGAMGRRRRNDHLPTFTAVEREACLDGLAAVKGLLEGKGDHDAAIEAELHRLSLVTYVDLLTRLLDDLTFGNLSAAEQVELGNSVYDDGDRVRFEIFEALRGTRYGEAKTFLWMHNWHAMKQTPEVAMNGSRMPSIGTRLAERYGSRLVAIANIIPCAAECEEPEGSVEPQFGARFGESIGVVDFSDPASVDGLAIDRPGTLFPNLHGGMIFTDVILSRQFDGAIYLPRGNTAP